METVVETAEADANLIGTVTELVNKLNKACDESLKRNISIAITMDNKNEGGVNVPVFALRGAWKQLVKKLIYTL
jgi:hypothetical protein